jgi:Caspase domain
MRVLRPVLLTLATAILPWPIALHAQVKTDQTPSTQADSALKLNVIVIGVTDFVYSKYKPDAGVPREDTVGGVIEKRCDEIEQFFKSSYTEQQVSVTVLCKAADTTKPAIEGFFLRRYPALAKDTLTLLFILSHGEDINPSEKSLFTPDLRIITSDTTDEDADTTSLSTSRGLLPLIASAPSGATVFAFIDTCHSGAFQNIAVTRLGQLTSDYGLEMNVMASSLPDDKSFGGSFTSALLTILGEKELCLNDSSLPTRIRNLIQNNTPLKLDPFQGRPITIIHYQDNACLDAPSRADSLVLLYAGTQLPATIYQVTKQSSNDLVLDGDLIGKSFEYVRLPRGKYNLTVSERGREPLVRLVDLTVKPQILYLNRATPLMVADAYSRLAHGAEIIGRPLTEVAILRQKAAAIYLANDAPQSADKQLATANASTSKELSSYASEAESDNKIPLILRTQVLVSAGQFKEAGDVLSKAAKRGDPTVTMNDAATTAYFAYVAAGDFAAAKKLKKNMIYPSTQLRYRQSVI